MRKQLTVLVAAAVLIGAAGLGWASSWNTFVIRDGSTTGTSPVIVDAGSQASFAINEGGMKAGWGTNDINGFTIGDITRLYIDRLDDASRYAPNTGARWAPYFNIWVTDGAGKYATIANTPSSANFQPLFTDNGDGTFTYDLSLTDLLDKTAQVYETVDGGYNSTNTWVHNLLGKNSVLTFGDILSLEIAPPVGKLHSGSRQRRGFRRRRRTDDEHRLRLQLGLRRYAQ